MVVLVTGDRNWQSYIVIKKTLKALQKKHKIKFLIQGGAHGADTIAKCVAAWLGITPITVDALWEIQHKAAGPIRNKKMLELLELFNEGLKDDVLVLAFHDTLKKSQGTKNMVELAKKAGINVKLIRSK
jgi:2-C-methyl-D-erythritol 4-phosphate cytidylyltransferase